MIIAILTTSCAACLAGCAKNADKTKNMHDANEYKVVLTDGEPDDGISPDEDNDRECPDGDCKNKGPHTGHGKRRKRPVIENFHFIIEFGPHCIHGKCPAEPENPDAPEILPAPGNGENGGNN